MTVPSERSGQSLAAVRIQKAEELLNSLVGVIDARIVTDEDGGIEEIHILSTSDLSPKQAVRNVESALLAHLDLAVDHRRISVAQAEPGEEPEPAPAAASTPVDAPIESHGPLETTFLGVPPRPSVAARRPMRRAGADEDGSSRFLFLGHQVTSERAHRVEMRVTLEWRGERYEGSAWTPDLTRPRLEAMAQATLQAMETALQAGGPEDWPEAALSLEGVQVLDAFDRTYVLVAVHAIEGRRVVHLCGTVSAGENLEAAVVLATLQATDRRVRRIVEAPPRRSGPSPPEPSAGDPFDIWG